MRSFLSRMGLLQPQVLLDLLDEAAAQLFAFPMHRQLRRPVAAPDGQMTAAALVRLEPAAAGLQSPPKLGRVHGTTLVLGGDRDNINVAFCRADSLERIDNIHAAGYYRTFNEHAKFASKELGRFP